jgi:hypothetical protein
MTGGMSCTWSSRSCLLVSAGYHGLIELMDQSMVDIFGMLL